ncbi:hypothetical protein MLD52_00135 [Puniceicoccaceae bacterium K14]|nr:hypothetical protein [Puniceicoccaceae bacterium K14]
MKKLFAIVAACVCLPSFLQAERIDNQDIIVGEFATGWPEKLSGTNFFSDLETLTPAPGVVAYAPNVNFWSDYAIKSRWVYVPFGETITFAAEGRWSFPTGTIWVKHFDMAIVRGEPEQGVTRLETRFLVKNRFGIFGVSYVWDEDGTDATLVDNNDYTFPIDVEIEGQVETLDWTIPSRSDCLTCHVSSSGFALSFNTPQLNREAMFDGVMQNIITYLDEDGYFDSEIPDPDSLPYYSSADDETASLNHRARSYLAVNCAYCHEPLGPLENNTWDARSTTFLTNMDIIDEDPAENGVAADVKIVVRGDASKSLMWQRLAVLGDVTRMPPLATAELDLSGMSLIQSWIEEALVDYEAFDEWIVSNFEDVTDPLVIGRDVDPDLDGDSNYLEYLNHTDPQSAESRSEIAIQNSESGLELAIKAAALSNYQIETSTDLENWGAIKGHGHSIRSLPHGENEIQFEIDEENQTEESEFYRVRVLER